MPENELLKQVIYESGELSRRGENQNALKLLDDLITRAMQENKDTWVRILCRHAAVICDHASLTSPNAIANAFSLIFPTTLHRCIT